MNLKSEFEKVLIAVDSVMELLNGQHFEAACLLSKKMGLEVEKFKFLLEPPPETAPVIELPLVELATEPPADEPLATEPPAPVEVIMEPTKAKDPALV